MLIVHLTVLFIDQNKETRWDGVVVVVRRGLGCDVCCVRASQQCSRLSQLIQAFASCQRQLPQPVRVSWSTPYRGQHQVSHGYNVPNCKPCVVYLTFLVEVNN